MHESLHSSVTRNPSSDEIKDRSHTLPTKIISKSNNLSILAIPLHDVKIFFPK